MGNRIFPIFQEKEYGWKLNMPKRYTIFLQANRYDNLTHMNVSRLAYLFDWEIDSILAAVKDCHGQLCPNSQVPIFPKRTKALKFCEKYLEPKWLCVSMGKTPGFLKDSMIYWGVKYQHYHLFKEGLK